MFLVAALLCCVPRSCFGNRVYKTLALSLAASSMRHICTSPGSPVRRYIACFVSAHLYVTILCCYWVYVVRLVVIEECAQQSSLRCNECRIRMLLCTASLQWQLFCVFETPCSLEFPCQAPTNSEKQITAPIMARPANYLRYYCNIPATVNCARCWCAKRGNS